MNNKTKTGKTDLLKSLIAEGLNDNEILERMKKEYPKITFKQEIFRVRQALAKESGTTWPGNQPDPKEGKRTVVISPKQILLDRINDRIQHYQRAYNSIVNLPDDIFELMDVSAIEQKMSIPAVKEQQPAPAVHTQVIKSGKTGKSLNKKREYKQLIAKLLSFRSEHQLTQADVAKLTKIPESTISNLEVGNNTYVQSKTRDKLNELFKTYNPVVAKENVNSGIPGNNKF